LVGAAGTAVGLTRVDGGFQSQWEEKRLAVPMVSPMIGGELFAAAQTWLLQ